MGEYRERLQRCGISASEAACICEDFIHEFEGSLKELEEYIQSLERDIYV